VGHAVRWAVRGAVGGPCGGRCRVARTPVSGHPSTPAAVYSYSVPPLRVRYAGLTALAIARPPTTGL
jgi:hypothetical protein